MNMLIPIIKYGLDLTDEAPMIVDQTEVIKFAKRQSVLPIIHRAYDKMGLSNDELNKLCYRDIFQFVNRDCTLQSIFESFENTHIPFIPLKGSVLRESYPEIWMRTSSDIDVLVHPEDIDRAITILHEKTDLRYKEKAYHDVLMTNNVVALELHFSLKEMQENIDQLLVKVWEYAEPVEGYHYAMSPEFMIFHNVAHMSYHITHGGLGIRPYIDLYLLKTKTKYDEEKLREMLELCELLKFYEYCCRLISAWFKDGEMDRVTEALEEFCFTGGVFGNKENAMATAQRQYSRINYVFHRAFESRYTMEQLYPVLQEKPYLLFWYHIKRWKKGLTQKRKNISEELDLLRRTSTKSIHNCNDLLNELGL